MKKTILFLAVSLYSLSCCTAPHKDEVSHEISKEGQRHIDDTRKDVDKFVVDKSAKQFINRELDELNQNILDLTAQNDALNSANISILATNEKLIKSVESLKVKAKRNLLIGGGIALFLKFLIWFILKFVVPSAINSVIDKIKQVIKDWFKKNVIDRIWKPKQP